MEQADPTHPSERCFCDLLLVDEVANIREDSVTQVHTQKARPEWSLQISFKILEHKCGQVRLTPKQAQQGGTVGWAFIVAG